MDFLIAFFTSGPMVIIIVLGVIGFMIFNRFKGTN